MTRPEEQRSEVESPPEVTVTRPTRGPMDVATDIVSRWEAQLAAGRLARGQGDYIVTIAMTADVRDRMVLDITVAINEAIRGAHG